MKDAVPSSFSTVHRFGDDTRLYRATIQSGTPLIECTSRLKNKSVSEISYILADISLRFFNQKQNKINKTIADDGIYIHPFCRYLMAACDTIIRASTRMLQSYVTSLSAYLFRVRPQHLEEPSVGEPAFPK